jgi:release factor glutamine methyltransferase
MTIGEAILAGEKQLVAAGIDSGRLETEMMLAQLREEPRLNLWLQRGDILTEGQREKLQDWLARRSTREPIQHILGWAPFLDFELHVTRDVLVPRPETEVLAQLAIQRLAGAAAPRVLDWGTGSGCLALAIAQAVPSAEVHALDVSPDALRIARANAIAYRLADRVRFHLGDGFDALKPRSVASGNGAADSLSPFVPLGAREQPEAMPGRALFDLIVTNPPYIPAAEVETLDPEVRLHDPRLALVGGDDGLECYRRLAAEALGWLKPGGWLLAEFGDGQAPALTDLFGKAGWNIEAVEKDLSGRDRILIVRAPVRD